MSSLRATYFPEPLENEGRIKLNDVSLQSLLLTVLSLQIALWAVMGLNVLGVSIPIVQPLIGFVYLTFIPGILVLTALRLRNLDIVETILYAVGLSVTVVLSIGFILYIVFNASNIIKPFSFLAVTSSVSLMVLVLCAISYFRNRAHPKPLFNTKMAVPLAPTLFLCILPLLTVFSSYLVNTYNIDTGQLFLWVILGVVVLIIAFNKFVPSKLYPLAVFVIALSLLYQQTLISTWMTGADIQIEWGLANSVLNSGVWNPTFINQYNGMLSVVALAPIYSLISSLDLVWIFKLVYPLIFALVPVGLYQIFRRQLNDKVAFLSSFFFMSFAPFFFDMPTLARQEVAEFFCVLFILLLVSNEMHQGIRSALFTTFSLSMVVSHYATTYLFFLFLFGLWLVLTVSRIDRSKLTLQYLRTKAIHKEKQIIVPSPKPPPKSVVTIGPLFLLFIALIAWYTYTAQATTIYAVLSLGSRMLAQIGELFSPTYSEAVNVIAQGPSPGILHRVNAFVNYLNQFFILAGICLVIFLKKQRFKLQFSYVVLSTMALGFLIASVVFPWLGGELNWTRVSQLTLILLAPFLAVGFIKIGQNTSDIMKKVTNKREFDNSAQKSLSKFTRLLAVYLVLFMLFSTGFIFALTESTGYWKMALSNQVDGQYSHQTIVGAKWQTHNSGGGVVYADYYNLNVIAALGLEQSESLQYQQNTSELSQAQSLQDPQNNSTGSSYIFLGTYNIEHNQALIYSWTGAIIHESYTDVTPLISNRSLIYSNGGASVYS